MTAMCEIFNLLHFRSTAQGGGGHGPSGPMVNTPVGSATKFFRGGEKYYIYFVNSLSLYRTVKEFSKLANS